MSLTLGRAIVSTPLLILEGVRASPLLDVLFHFAAAPGVILTTRYAVGVLPDWFLLLGVVGSYAVLALGFIRFWRRGYRYRIAHPKAVARKE